MRRGRGGKEEKRGERETERWRERDVEPKREMEREKVPGYAAGVSLSKGEGTLWRERFLPT